MPLLVGALGDTAATVRVAALDQLRVIDKKFAATVFAPIANCIGDADGKVRKAAVEALGATALRDRSFQRELEHSVERAIALAGQDADADELAGQQLAPGVVELGVNFA